MANQQKTSRVVVFACVSGTVGGVIGQVDEPKKSVKTHKTKLMDGMSGRVKSKRAMDRMIVCLVWCHLNSYYIISSNQKFKNKWKMSLNDILSKHFCSGFSSLLYVKAAGLRSGWSLARFWVGVGKRTWTCVCFINKSSNYTSCYSTLQHTQVERNSSSSPSACILF